MPVRYGLRFCAPIERDDLFEVFLDLGYGQHRVLLGTHSGDLYVLARTFVQQYHAIPHSILESAEVGTIVDLGVNIGMASLTFHARYPTARVIAIEPLEANYRLSCRNTEKIAAVVLIHAAVVGAPRGAVWMTTSARAWGKKLVTDGKAVKVEPVPALTVDELLDQCGLDCVDILKVDIEGPEGKLLAQPSFLARVGLVVIELHSPYDLAAFQRDIAPPNFVVLPPDPRAGRRMLMALRADRVPR